MPLPVLIRILVAVATAVGTGVAAKVAKNKPKVDGKFLLIGPSLSGKSTLGYFLKHDKYPEVEFKTGIWKESVINLPLSSGGEAAIVIIDQKGTRPFSVGEKDREQWKSGLQEIGKGGSVLYVVSSQSLTGANMDITNEDVKWLKKHLRTRPIKIVITHLDQVPLAEYAGFAQFNPLNAEELWRGNLLEKSEMIELKNRFKNLVEQRST